MESIFILVLIVAVVCLDIATFLWGCDSRDGIDSPHWAQLQQWRALHEETTTSSKAWQPSRPGYQRPPKSDMEDHPFRTLRDRWCWFPIFFRTDVVR